MKVNIQPIDLFNLALHQQEQGLIFHGNKTGTFLFGVGRLKAAENLSKARGIKLTIASGGIRNRVGVPIYKSFKNILEKEKGRKWMSKFIKVPSIFYPRYFREIDGHKFSLWDGEPDIATKGLLEDYKTINEWEPETTKLIKEVVKEGDVCLDIGASTGPLTLQMCRLAKTVIAVEPTERCFNYLCRNLELNGYKNCIPLKMAAWDKSELVRMPLNDPHPIYANGIALDDWLEANGFLKVDFIKMDIDGPEPKALKGLVRTFERNPQLKMIIEYYPKYILGVGCNPVEFLDIINKYFTYKIIEHEYGEGCWNLLCTRI